MSRADGLTSALVAPLRGGWERWRRFWFEPRETVTIGLYRILYGASILLFLALLWPDVLAFFSDRGVLGHTVARGLMYRDAQPSLLLWLSAPWAVIPFFALLSIAAVCLTIGVYSRVSAAVVFLGLVSVGGRNPLALNGADVVLRVMGFYLILAPCGAALSVDRLRALARGTAPPQPPWAPPWAQRLMQLQLALIYASTVLLKLKGQAWTGGVAIYCTSRLEEFHRFPVPYLFHSMLVVNLLTYWTMAVEAALGFLVWIPALRPLVLLNGLLLHAGIEYSMNVPQFSFAMVGAYVTFINAESLWQWLLARRPRRLRAHVTLKLNPDCAACRRTARLTHALDLLREVEIEAGDGEQPLLIAASGREFAGDAAGRALTRRLPLLWPAAALRLAIGRRWLLGDERDHAHTSDAQRDAPGAGGGGERRDHKPAALATDSTKSGESASA